MRAFQRVLAVAAAAFWSSILSGLPDRPVWPLTLREALPLTLAGWAAAPKEDLPEEDENEMGKYTEVSRFFQRIESPTSAKQFRLVIQDYDGKQVGDAIRKAVAEARKTGGVEAREFDAGGHKAFSVTDRSSGRPATIVTVVVTPTRLVLGQGANVTGDEAVGLVKQVDFARVAAVRKEQAPPTK